MEKNPSIWRMGFRIAGIIWTTIIALFIISFILMATVSMFAIGWEQYWSYIAK